MIDPKTVDYTGDPPEVTFNTYDTVECRNIVSQYHEDAKKSVER